METDRCSTAYSRTAAKELEDIQQTGEEAEPTEQTAEAAVTDADAGADADRNTVLYERGYAKGREEAAEQARREAALKLELLLAALNIVNEGNGRSESNGEGQHSITLTTGVSLRCSACHGRGPCTTSI